MRCSLFVSLFLSTIPFTHCISPLSASPVTQVYTQIDSQRSQSRGVCKTIKSEGYRDHPLVTERCPSGPGGWSVTMFSADARSHVWFGKAAEEGTSVPEALEGAFADPHGTIEWRIADGRPFAAIHRYFIDKASVLLVHRLQPDKTSCVAALVRPIAGRNANNDAIEIADKIAPTFKCGRSPLLIDGQPQVSPQKSAARN